MGASAPFRALLGSPPDLIPFLFSHSSFVKMPDIPVGAQIFDLAFHPNRPIVYTGLLTGHIKAFGYDEQGNHEAKFSLRPSKKSCRALALSMDGDQLWAAGKAKAIQCVLSHLEERTGARLTLGAVPQHHRRRHGRGGRHPRGRARVSIRAGSGLRPAR